MIDVQIDVDIVVSYVPNATELEKIAEEIALELGIDPARVSVAITINNGSATLTITINGMTECYCKRSR